MGGEKEEEQGGGQNVAAHYAMQPWNSCKHPIASLHAPWVVGKEIWPAALQLDRLPMGRVSQPGRCFPGRCFRCSALHGSSTTQGLVVMRSVPTRRRRAPVVVDRLAPAHGTKQGVAWRGARVYQEPAALEVSRIHAPCLLCAPNVPDPLLASLSVVVLVVLVLVLRAGLVVEWSSGRVGGGEEEGRRIPSS